MEKLTTKQTTKQTTELAGWRAGWLANPVVVTDKLRLERMRRADRASVTNFLAVKVACKSRPSSERHGLKHSKKSPPKKVQNTGPTTTATKQRTSSYRTPLAAAHPTIQQAKNSSPRASFPKWILILGRSRSGRHPQSAGFSWIAQLRFGPHFLEELGGRSSSSSSSNNINNS
ncbi:unnamed protein product [Sphagnum troendelagicum]|uniref:Uncharacterized protein n=1 Tax=Sphagnum troendelagicum TaxID=128251 RepID=A0ABP0TUA3_9BRYO